MFWLVWTMMSLENRKRKNIFPFRECFNQTLSKYIPSENKIRKNKNYKDFLLNTNKYFQAEIWKTSLENMEDKILGFQFETVSSKPTHPSYKLQKLRHFVLKVKQDSWHTTALEFTEAVVCMFFKIGVLKNFTIFTEKHLSWISFW